MFKAYAVLVKIEETGALEVIGVASTSPQSANDAASKNLVEQDRGNDIVLACMDEDAVLLLSNALAHVKLAIAKL
jgi:hypothetical protein